MIIDRLENSSLYTGSDDKLQKAFAFLSAFCPDGAACGRHEIDGDRVYAMVSNYETVPAAEKKMEAHRRYIDIQYVASGSEAIGYAPLTGLPVEQAYDAENDFLLVKCDNESMLRADAGTFLILYPQDGHRPGCVLEQAQQVVKVVVKVAVDL